MRKINLKIKGVFFILTICLLIGNSTIAQTQGTRPNIVFILTDDLGYSDVGFNRGNDFPTEYGAIPTPELDNLADSGVVFTKAHVAHMFCGPSRAALLTGVYPHRLGAQYNLPNNILDTSGVTTNETFFSTVLQENGYNTGLIGKWHLGVQTQYHPNSRGFDEFLGFTGGGKNYYESYYEDMYYRRLETNNPVTNEYQTPLERNRGYVGRDDYDQDENVTDIFSDESVDFINKHAKSPDPFFLFVSYNAPHTPLQISDEDLEAFKQANPNFESDIQNSPDIINANLPDDGTTREEYTEELVQDRLAYAAMVAKVDEGVGRIKEALKTNGIENNTLVIFLSDNGGKLRKAGGTNYPLSAGKGSVDEGGHRVPMFMTWPGTIPAGETYNHLVSSLDFYPSFLKLAGANVPENKLLEGVDITDKVIGNVDVRSDKPLFVMRPYNGFHNGGIMSGKWKISKKANGDWKLFDIENDPGETKNVRHSDPNGEAIVNSLLDQAIAWVVDFKDVVPNWYDHYPHPHAPMWEDGRLPGYDRLFGEEVLHIDEVINSLVSISPNPSRDVFNLKFNKTVSCLNVEILSMSGKHIKTINLNNIDVSKLDVTELPAGMYIIKIKSDDDLSIEKVVKL